MRTSIKITTFAIAASLLAACSPQTASMTAQQAIPQATPPVYADVKEIKSGWVTEDGGQGQLDFNPQVDILFITDNSDSMRTAQSNLVRNIDKFSDGIVKNKMIDYHIGVTATWDSSERFLTQKKDKYGIGELRFIKDSKQTYNKRFVTRAESNLMASTLDIGVASYADGGPENEEFFSPLVAALDKSGNGAPNDGFFRPDAQLVVIFLTDADDGSTLSADEVERKLLDFKGGRRDKVSLYGALVSAKDSDENKDYGLRIMPKYHAECFDMTKKTPVKLKNPAEPQCLTGFGPTRLEQLIAKVNQDTSLSPAQAKAKYIMDLTSHNFGSDLAGIGADIKMKTMAKEIYLTKGVPVVENGVLQVRVRYGTGDELAAGKGQLIPMGKGG